MNWLLNLISDQNGNPSSKRLIGFAILGLLIFKIIKTEYSENDMQLIEQLLFAVCTIAGISLMEIFKVKKDTK